MQIPEATERLLQITNMVCKSRVELMEFETLPEAVRTLKDRDLGSSAHPGAT
jgi:hypothetical protein